MPTRTELPTVMILVGGLGTRLRAVIGENVPKPLAPIDGEPFLKRLLTWLFDQGFRDVVLLTGHLAEEFENQVAAFCPEGMSVRFSVEETPLGTGGAIANARTMVTTDPVLVLNGDSVASVNLQALIDFHADSQALATLALVAVPDASRFGTVTLTPDSKVASFIEKQDENRKGLINAGMYVLSTDFMNSLPEGAFSIERDVFPNLLEKGVFGMAFEGQFIDIGTPESYSEAANFFQEFGK